MKKMVGWTNLRKSIELSGMTIKEVAEQTGMRYTYVASQCKTGVTTIKAAVRYAKVLGLPVCKILGVGDVCNCKR